MKMLKRYLDFVNCFKGEKIDSIGLGRRSDGRIRYYSSNGCMILRAKEKHFGNSEIKPRSITSIVEFISREGIKPKRSNAINVLI